MGEGISMSLKIMGSSLWWVRTKTGQAFRCAVTKMVQAVRWVRTKTGQAFRCVVTKMVQAVRCVLTKTGQAVKWVLTKPGQLLASLVARLYYGCRKLGRAGFSTVKGFLPGGVSGKPQSPGSPVSLNSGPDHRIDIPVGDEHQVLDTKKSPVSKDEPKSADVVTKSSTLPVAVPVPEVPPRHLLLAVKGLPTSEDEEKSAGVAGKTETSVPMVAVPGVVPKHQLVAVKGSTIGEDEEKSVGIVCGSSALPVAVPQVSPKLSYKQVVKQVSPVMFDNLFTLSEPKQPRFGKLGRYDGGQRILLVGEGDFSFSACLAAAFGDASNMVATSLDTFDFLRKNYKSAPENIKELKRRGCEVIHRVNATKMANHPRLCSVQFDRIIYNFPFWGFSIRNEPREVQISYHQSLVLGFMENAKEMIGDDCEIHITHKSNGFSKEWNIVELGTSAGLELVGAVQFKLQKYPGYCTKYGFGGDKDFDCHPSKTYKFKLAPKKKSRRKRKN